MSARSYLYVPGTRADRFDKAVASGADAVILDLEDAVSVSEKDEARSRVAGWLSTHRGRGPEIWVRINQGALMEEDARAVTQAGGRRISLPKASVDELARLDVVLDGIDVVVNALVETASGILEAAAIASAPRVVRLAIGEADLCSELGITDTEALASMRAHVVLASAAARLAPPIASVSTDFRDLEGFRTSTVALKRAGFGARAAIHPDQVPIVNEVFTPTTEEIDSAKRLLAAFEAGGGGVTVAENGRMIDEAVVRAARRVLETGRG